MKEKKLIIIATIVILAILALGGYSLKKKQPKDVFLNITVSQLKEKFRTKDTFALYIGNDNCSACDVYKPTLESVIKKYNIKLYYLDSGKLSNEDYYLFNSMLSIRGTPTIVFIKNGEETTTLNRIVGAESKSKTIDKFKDNGYIK